MYGVETYENEWCVSVPPAGNCGRTPRMQIIELMSGVPDMRFMLRFKGKNSRAVQHELDHFSKTFFFDRMARREKDRVMERYQEWRRERHAKVFKGA